MLHVASLNSGSNGNCYYIGNEQEAILVDAGISCRETEQRMRRLELSMKKVKAIFITHEHADHIHGLTRLSKKYQLPVYITEMTRRNGKLILRDDLTFDFKAHSPIRIGNLSVSAFPIFHDASDPHGFLISGNEVNVGIFTDIGRLCKEVVHHFEKCHAAFLESNYDEKLLETGSYPASLKNRIRDGHGHVSNKQALQLFMNHRPATLTHLFLSHLSMNNNSPRIVKDLFASVAGGTEIVIASRYNETKVYQIKNLPGVAGRQVSTRPETAPCQLTLF